MELRSESGIIPSNRGSILLESSNICSNLSIIPHTKFRNLSLRSILFGWVSEEPDQLFREFIPVIAEVRCVRVRRSRRTAGTNPPQYP